MIGVVVSPFAVVTVPLRTLLTESPLGPFNSLIYSEKSKVIAPISFFPVTPVSSLYTLNEYAKSFIFVGSPILVTLNPRTSSLLHNSIHLDKGVLLPFW